MPAAAMNPPIVIDLTSDSDDSDNTVPNCPGQSQHIVIDLTVDSDDD
jgi:hypothetical protein